MALVNTGCGFRGKESLTYYQGSFPQYKQGPDGRYYPVDSAGNFAPLDYSYRPDLQGYAVVVPGRQQQGNYPPGALVPVQPGNYPAGAANPQQGAPGAAVLPRTGPIYGNNAQGGAMVAPGMARAQQTPPPRYVPQPPAYGNQPYAPVPQQAYGAYGGYAMPGYAPQQYPTGAYQQQPPYGQVPQPPPQSQPRIVMPSGYYGDNDEEYQIGVSKEQIEHEAAEQRAGQIQLPASMLPQTQPVQPQPTGAQPFQQPVRTGAAPTPKLPDLNKIYSNVTSDSDAAYQIPPGYDQQDIEDYNTFYSN